MTITRILILTLLMTLLIIGTAATANKRQTALRGVQLPSWLNVTAGDSQSSWPNLRDYVRSLSRR
jgi:hypothetical protein